MQRLSLLCLIALAGCAQFGKRIPGTENFEANSSLEMVLPVSHLEAESKLKDYLSLRGLGLSSSAGIYATDTVYQTRWTRDSSLVLYLIDGLNRSRHLAQWKSEWKVTPHAANTTLVHLSIYEVVYWGRPEEAPAAPPSPLEGWYEADPNQLRSLLEMRRFLQTEFPREPLPKNLVEVRAPDLNFPPRGKLIPRWSWKKLSNF